VGFIAQLKPTHSQVLVSMSITRYCLVVKPEQSGKGRQSLLFYQQGVPDTSNLFGGANRRNRGLNMPWRLLRDLLLTDLPQSGVHPSDLRAGLGSDTSHSNHFPHSPAVYRQLYGRTEAVPVLCRGVAVKFFGRESLDGDTV